ncbi:hypothetical protein BC832DRAFT_385864 [Gaertneriomyces semiglobifer]|nr:hypothetical protein BC832DRAFT_385864 [Gaertneriomyces semiglobifer]
MATYEPAPATPSDPRYTDTDMVETPRDLTLGHEAQYQAVAAYSSSPDVTRVDSPNDPEDILNQAADEGYRKQPKQSIFRKFLNLYKPVYDYKTPGLSDEERRIPRYCNGRFKRWQWILINVLVIFLILLIIFVPLAYFVLVPAFIQGQLNNIKLDTLDLQKMLVTGFTPETAGFEVKASLPAPFWLPLTAHIGETDVQVYTKDDKKNGLVNVHIPGLSLTLNKPVEIDMAGYASLDHCNPEKTLAVVTAFSSDEGLKDIELQARGKFPIKALGITWYKGLPLYVNIGHITEVNSQLKPLLKALPQFLKAKNLNQAIRSKFRAEDLITILSDIGLGDMKIDDMKVQMNDAGVQLDLSLWLENPLKLTLKEITGLEFGIALEKNAIAKVRVPSVSLGESLQKLDLKAEITFDDPSISPETVSSAITAVIQKVLVDKNYDVKASIVGPLKIHRGDWVQSITGPLAIYLPMKEILGALQLNKITDLLTLDGIKDLIGSTDLAAYVDSTKITIPVKVALPRLLPLPPIVVPYNMSLGVYAGPAGNTKTLDLDLWGLKISTTDKDMIIEVTAVATPVNTAEAADALAYSINPILAAAPVPSKIWVKDIKFFAPGQPPFRWSEMLFKNMGVEVPLPTIICMTCIVDLLTNNGTALPLSVNGFAIDQMTAAPGFAALGSVNVEYPPGAPHLEVSLGYASLDLAVERIKAATVNMPTGLQFIPNAGPVNINAEAILSREPALPGALQNLVNGFLKDGSIPTYAGVTNLVFGPSAQNAFITFSKISIELNIADMKDLVNRVVENLKGSLLKPGMVKVTGADLEVATSTKLNLGLQADITNPMNVSISLGHIDIDALVDDGRLISLALPPVKIVAGPGGIDLKMEADVATGANGMAAKVAKLVDEVLNSNPISSLFGITNLVLSPPGKRGQADPAVIDQLKPVKIEASGDLISELNPISNPDSPIDISGLIPGADIFERLNIDVQSASLDTRPAATLGAGAAVGYTNPLALSAKLPYGGLLVGLSGSDLVDVRVAEIQLVRGPGGMTPKIILAFNNGDASIPDKMAEFVKEFIDGRIMFGVTVRNVLFGGSANDVNDLLSAVHADLSPLTEGIDTGKIIDAVLAMLPIKFPVKIPDMMSNMAGLFEGTLGVETLPQKTLGVDAAVGLKLPFSLALNAGFFSSRIGINTHPLLGLNLPTGVQIAPPPAPGGSSSVALKTTIPFEDDEPAQVAVGNVVANFFAGLPLATTIDINGLAIGVSPSDIILALSKINLRIPLDRIIAVDGPTDIFTLMKGMGVGDQSMVIGGAVVETRPGNNLGLVADLGLKMGLALNAKIGYVGADVGLNTNPMLEFRLPTGLALVANNNATRLNLNTALRFTDNDATQTAVAVVVNNFVTGKHLGAIVGIDDLAIGYSETDRITALSKVAIPADLERALALVGVKLPFSLSGALGGLDAKVLGAKVHTAPQNRMLLGAQADFALPFPISVRLGHAALSALVDSYPLVDVILPAGLGLNTTQGRAGLNLDATMQFVDGDEAQTSLARIVDDFLNSDKVDGHVGVNKVFLGNSAAPEDRLTVLSKIDVNLALDEVIRAAGFSIPMDISELANSISNIGTIDVATTPGRSMAISAGADFALPLPFPVDAKIGFLGARSGLSGNPLLDLNVPTGILYNTIGGNKAIALNASAVFTDVEATQDEVAKILDQVLHSDNVDSVFDLHGINIGDSANDLITAFRKVAVHLDIGRLIKQMGIKLPLEFGQVASNLDLDVEKVTMKTLPQKTLQVGAAAGFTLPLPFNLNFKTGYFHTRGHSEGVPLFRVSLPEPLALSAGGDKRKNLNATMDVHFDISDGMLSPVAIALLVQRALTEETLGVSVSLDGIILGSSAAEADIITVLRKAELKMDLDKLTEGIIDFPIDVSKFKGIAGLADGTVMVGTKPGKVMDISANIGLNIPFELDAQIGYLGAGIGASLNGQDPTQLAKFALPQGLRIFGAKDQPKIVNFTTEIVFIDDEAQQMSIAEMVKRAFNGPADDKGYVLQGTADVFEIAMGATSTDFIDMLSMVYAQVQADQIAAMMGVKLPLQLGDLAGNLDAKIADIALETLPQQTLSLGAKAGFKLPLNVQANIGYTAATIGINNEQLLDAALPNLVIAPGADKTVSLGVNATAKFYDSPKLRQELNSVVDWVLNGGDKSAIANLRNVFLGNSANPADSITAFSKIDVPIELATFLPGLGIKVPLDLTGAMKDVNLQIGGDVDLAVMPGKVVKFSGTAGIKLPFNVNVKAGWVGADAAVNDAPLARVGMPLTIAPDANGNVALTVNTNVQIIEDAEKTPVAVATVVDQYFSGAEMESTAGVAGIRFGFSETDVIGAFTELRVALPLKAIVGKENRLEPGKIIADLIRDSQGGLSSLVLRQLGFGIAPNNELDAAIKVGIPGLQLPIKVAANVPYIHIDDLNLAIEKFKMPLAAATMNALELTKAMDFGTLAKINIKDSDELAGMIKNYFDIYKQTKHLPGSLGLGSMIIGTGPNDAILALSKSNLPIMVDPIVQALAAAITDGGSNGGLDISVTVGADGTITAIVKHPLIGEARIGITKVDVNFGAGQTINTGIAVNMALPFPLTLDLPYFSVKTGVDDITKVPFLDALMAGLKTGGGTNSTNSALGLGLDMKFHDGEILQRKIAGLVALLMAKQSIPGDLVLAGIGIGSSPDNQIKAFSKLELAIPFNWLFGTAGNAQASIGSPIDLIKAIGLKLSNLSAKTESGRRLVAGVQAGFSSNFPLTITGLNHFAMTGGIDESRESFVDVFDAAITGLNVAPGANSLNLGAGLTFPSDGKIQDAVAKLFRDILKPDSLTQSVAVSKLVFGTSEADGIKCFRLARLGISAKALIGETPDASSLIELIGQIIGVDLKNMTPDQLMKMLRVNRAIADLGQPGTISLDLDAGLTNLTLTADVNFGYVFSAAALNEEKLADVHFADGLHVVSKDNMLALALKLALEVNDSDQIQTIIADIINKVIAGTATDDTAGLSGLLFGVSRDDSIDTFAKANIAMKIQPFVKAISDFIKPILDGALNGDFKMPEGWGLDAIDVDSEGENTLGIDIAGHSPNNGQFGLNLPYATMGVALDKHDFVKPVIENIRLDGGKLGGHIATEMIKDELVIKVLGVFLSDLVFHRPLTLRPQVASVKGIVFGTKERPFNLLRKVDASITLTDIIDRVWKHMNENQIEIDDIDVVMTQRGFEGPVKIPVGANIPLNLKWSTVDTHIWYRVGGQGQQYHVSEVVFNGLRLVNGAVEFTIGIFPDPDPVNGIIEPLHEALERLLTWNSFSRNSAMGYVTFVGSNGVKMTTFDKMHLPSPDLTLWEPLYVKIPVLIPPIQDGGIAPLPFGAEIWFPNPWALGIEVGRVHIAARNGGRDLIRLQTTGIGQILNKNDGGATKGTRNFIFGVILPINFGDILKNILNPIGAIRDFFQQLKDLFNPNAYDLVITSIDRDNKEIVWFTKCMDVILTPRFLGKSLMPIITALLTKAIINAFGVWFKIPFLKLEDLPFIKPLSQEADRILAGLHPNIRFDSPFMGNQNNLVAQALTPEMFGLPALNLPANFTLEGIPADNTTVITTTLPAAPTSALPSVSATPTEAAPAPSVTPAPSDVPPVPAQENEPTTPIAKRRLQRRKYFMRT